MAKDILKRSTNKLTRARHELPEIRIFFNVAVYTAKALKPYFANKETRILE